MYFDCSETSYITIYGKLIQFYNVAMLYQYLIEIDARF